MLELCSFAGGAADSPAKGPSRALLALTFLLRVTKGLHGGYAGLVGEMATKIEVAVTHILKDEGLGFRMQACCA